MMILRLYHKIKNVKCEMLYEFQKYAVPGYALHVPTEIVLHFDGTSSIHVGLIPGILILTL